MFWIVLLLFMCLGLVNVFLFGFIESMVDFGNLLVLGGNFDVFLIEIFFVIVGV